MAAAATTTDSPATKGECGACGTTTSKACGGCGKHFVCCRAHQKLLWPTHRWLCGKDETVFTFPTFTPEQLQELKSYKKLGYLSKKSGAMTYTLLDHVHVGEYLDFRDGWEKLFKIISTDPEKELITPSWRRTWILACAHVHLAHYSSKAAGIDLPTAPWFVVGMFCHDLRGAVPAGSHFNDVWRLFNDILRNFLSLASITDACRWATLSDTHIMELHSISSARFVRAIDHMPTTPEKRAVLRKMFVDDSALNVKGTNALGWRHCVLFDERGDEAVRLGGLEKVPMEEKGEEAPRVSVVNDMTELRSVWKEVFKPADTNGSS
ncbi:hypothetical protein JCM8097_008511 [Rhodosporidiobolus ruineniae]